MLLSYTFWSFFVCQIRFSFPFSKDVFCIFGSCSFFTLTCLYFVHFCLGSFRIIVSFLLVFLVSASPYSLCRFSFILSQLPQCLSSQNGPQTSTPNTSSPCLNILCLAMFRWVLHSWFLQVNPCFFSHLLHCPQSNSISVLLPHQCFVLPFIIKVFLSSTCLPAFWVSSSSPYWRWRQQLEQRGTDISFQTSK